MELSIFFELFPFPNILSNHLADLLNSFFSSFGQSFSPSPDFFSLQALQPPSLDIDLSVF